MGAMLLTSEYTASAGIAVIDTQTNEIITVIGGLGDTFNLQISPDGTRLFVAAGSANAVHVIDAVNFTYLTSVGFGGRTFDMSSTRMAASCLSPTIPPPCR